ncbi:unnamed protein product [Schistosoma rodhaini]|uniref:Kinesin heavy chain n=1 Tax=Schistosoma rodhaini TaxID=6188 RepID=A0AA85FQ73_9TREM|nr:unnamed protein product [Schistosoma rodhaini]
MSESIKVICRVRPLNDLEKANDSKFVVSFPGDGKTAISIGGKNFNFDHVVQPKATQLEVYEIVAKPIVADVLNGYNGTIFAYGQTSSGKTFTMEGILGDPVFQGVIPRIIHDIFNHIYQMDENLEFHIKVSYFEIYMDKIRDLLDVSKTNLPVHEDKDRVPYVKGATERFVSSPEEVFDVIDEGKANRHVAVTNMNEHSSRSHSVFMITVRQENLETQKKLHGKLYLVDLAGSEKVAKTGAEGTVLDEAKNINKSLSALGNVINALVEGSSHVPYRDSKLTRILQESLGGNARTTMVICCSPAAFNDAETKSTLMFGMRAKTIKNLVTVNEELTADEWRRRYEREKEKVRRLQNIVSHLESELKRWRGETQYSAAIDDTKDITAPDVFPTKLMSDSISATTPQGVQLSNTSQARTASLPSSRVAAISDTLSSTAGGVGDEQLQLLYQQLDDKDDEINKQAQTIARLRQQVEEQDEIINTLRKEREGQLKEITNLQAEYQSSKEEVKEVLQALEELAMNYDQKAQEIASKAKELEDVQESLLKQTRLMHSKDGELSQLKDTHQNQKKKYTEMMSSLLKDLIDVGECLNDQLTKPSVGAERLDEEFTVVRLYISKMKTEAKSLQSRVRQLEEERVQHVQLMRKSDDESKDLRTRLHAFEVKIATLTDKIDESESRKRHLQETVDNMNAEIAKLRANEQFMSGSGEQNEKILSGQSAIRAKLDEEFKRQSEHYAAQVKSLRDELDEKQKKLEEYKDEANNFKFQSEKSQEEVTRLREELENKTTRLETLEKTTEKREQAKEDLRGLEETVIKELQTLHNLRRLFIQDLNCRIKKSANRVNALTAAEKATANNNSNNNTNQGGNNTPNAAGGIPGQQQISESLLMDDDDDDEPIQVGTLAQREKIAFLENNLDKLTKVHKQLVHDNAELRCELPKMEKRLKSTLERVRSLELSLKEAKEGAMRDRKRYQVEVERIKEVVRQRNVTARRGQSQIAKPIRAGHAPITNLHGVGGASINSQPVVRPDLLGAP